MKNIQRFVRDNRKVIIAIGICLIANLFLFYSHGIAREIEANGAYIKFIENFPNIISSVRVEPFFIISSYYFSKLIGSDIYSIMIIKNLTTIAQLYVFYRIIKLFTKNELISIFSVFFLNFSFAYFSLGDNLLRNHLANLFFLISIYFIFELFFFGKLSQKNFIAASLNGGILLYTHILPALIFNFGLIAIFLFLFSYYIFKNRKLPDLGVFNFSKELKILKYLLMLGISILVLQSPYIARMIQARPGVGDYKIENSSEKNISPQNIISTTQELFSTDIMQVPAHDQLKSFYTKTKIFLSEIFRILFEYRLPGFSIFFIFLTFLSLLILLKKISPFSPETALLFFWLLIYLGSKVDLFFGIGTLPYRFSLMLVFPSLIILSLGLNDLLRRIKNQTGKIFFTTVLFISFLGINFPLLTEASILKNSNPDTAESRYLQSIYENYFAKEEGLVFLINGASFENMDDSSTFLRNSTPFTTAKEEEIVSFMKVHHVDYVVFDLNRIDQKGNDIGSIINTNLAVYKQSSYFENIGEYIGEGTHLIIFKFYPLSQALKSEEKEKFFDCREDKNCITEFVGAVDNSESEIINWAIEVDHSDKQLVTEYVFLKNGNLIKISYLGTSFENTYIDKSGKITLFDFKKRNYYSPRINLYISSALLLARHNNLNIDYLNLEKFSVNQLTISGKMKGSSAEYAALMRNGYKILIHLLSLLMIALVYLFALIWQKIGSGRKFVLDIEGRKNKLMIFSLLFFSTIDMLFLNMLFTETYKKLIGA